MSQAVAARGVPRARRRRKRTALRTHAASPSIEYSLLLTSTLCLLAFGAVMVFSASSTTSILGGTGDGAYYLKRTVMFGALGLVAMRVLSLRGLRVARALTPLVLVVSFIGLVAVMVPGVGMEANGAHRWIAFGPIQIQPSEIAKVALILYGAHLIAARPRIVRDVRALFPYLLVVSTAGLLVMAEPDLGTALVISFSVATLLIAGGVKLRHLGLVAGALVLLALIAILIEPYRRARLLGFLHPGADAGGAGFQAIQAKIALGSGGIFGVGLGESVQKAFYLPEAHTDMIAAVIGEELGLVGITVLIGLFGMFGYAGMRTAQHARDTYAKLLAAGLTSLVMIQAVVNLAATMGLAPLTGVPLPFVSYGNSNLLVVLAAVGLLLNVSRGGTAKLRVIEGGRSAALRRGSRTRGKSGHSGRRYRRARGAGARRRRRAAR